MRDGINGSGTLDQEKLTAWIHGHEFHTIVGDIRFGPDGDWTEAKILTEQFHDIQGTGVEQFREGRVETLLEPSALRSGSLVEPNSAIAR